MKVNFKFNKTAPTDPIVIEQVFAEKPGGGMIKALAYDAPTGTAVSENTDGTFSLIKAFRLVENVATGDTTIKIAKGSGIAVGDVLGHDKLAVACTAVF